MQAEKQEAGSNSQASIRHKIGFYAPDPGHRGKSPNLVLAETEESVTVYEFGNEMVVTLDRSEWMGGDDMRARFLEVATGPRYNNGGPMADMRDRILEGYVDVLCEAIDIAPKYARTLSRLGIGDDIPA